MSFAESLSKRVVAVHVTSDLSEVETLRAEWEQVVGQIPLEIIESPYRTLLPPLLAYVDALREMSPGDLIVVVLPELVPRHWRSIGWYLSDQMHQETKRGCVACQRSIQGPELGAELFS